MHAPVEIAESAANMLARLRARAPRVHCITNTVAQQYTANMLLAVGAVPSMTISPEEVASFVADADALLVNLGTFDAERRAAIDVAIRAAKAARMPWVLDPAFIDRAPARAEFARQLVGRAPAVVRLNTAELAALSGGDPAGDAAARFAKTHGTVVALTGGVDRVTDGVRRAVIANGDPLMAAVTAMGCAGSALVCAALTVEPDAWLAAAAAVTALGVAGEVAAEEARGPGSFAGLIIDALHGLDAATLRARSRVS
ncbi:MAG: hydroxyethylthiazole kinase [Xanthobacteraceae bacterium]|nr:hydroxyethylthiazole kinase [Xanthobacteraceae bacterium]